MAFIIFRVSMICSKCLKTLELEEADHVPQQCPHCKETFTKNEDSEHMRQLKKKSLGETK